MKINPHIRSNHALRKLASRQGGYLLLVILLMVTMLIIGMTVAAPRIATQLKRQQEEELIHRGNDYARAIKKFYRKFGRFPTRLEELENTNNIRFLRRRWTDPITGKEEWRLVRFGQAQFNRPPAGGQQGGTGGGGPLGAGFGTGGAGQQAPGQPLGQQIGTPAGQGGTPTIGGGAIVGVASTSTARGIHEINGKQRYNEWEFVYDPRQDRGMGQPGGVPGQQVPGQQMPGQQLPGMQQQQLQTRPR